MRLDKLRRHRNALAHGQKPDANDKIKILVVIEEVVHELPLTLPGAGMLGKPQTDIPMSGLLGRRILWVDDHPENNRIERRWLQELGAEVFPVLTNDEALDQSVEVRPHVIVTDIDRGGGEPGILLHSRLKETAIFSPLIFYVGTVDRTLPLPPGAIGITSDPAELLQLILGELRPPPYP